VIDFRYHLVSIVAIFLALAVGIVVGTTALNGYLLDDLRGRVDTLTQANSELRTEVRSLEAEVELNRSFADTVAPSVLASRLEGEPVLVLSAPGASTSARDAVVTRLEQAGARIAGRVRLRPAYADPTRDAEVKDLVARLVPPGVALPAAASATDQAAVELAAALVRGSDEGPSEPARTAIVEGFVELGLIGVEGPSPTPARLAVVVAAPPQGDRGEDAQAREVEAMTVLARELDQSSEGVLVAGPPQSAARGGLVSALRSSDLATSVSTVDNVDRVSGQVAAVLGLVEQSQGAAGHYGAAERADALLPDYAR